MCIVGLAWGASAGAAVQSTSIGFDVSSYLYANQPGRDAIFPSIDGRWRGHSNADARIEKALELEGLALLQPTEASFYFEVPEAYLGARVTPTSPFKISLGRKRQDWSALDQTWQLGIWQPRFRWDYIRPESVGLTGAFLEYERGPLRVTGFGSPFYVPERGVSVSVEDGTVLARSPWFISPPSQVNVMNRNTPALYSLQLPAVRDLVLHPSYALQVRVGETQGFWGAVSGARKPMNQLLLAYEGWFQHTPAGQQPAVAMIHPRALMHQVESLDLGYRNRRASAVVSGMLDRPVRDVTPATWTTQEVMDARVVSATVAYGLGGDLTEKSVVEASWIRVWGGNAPDAGADVLGTGSVFDGRYPFQNALSVGIRGTFPQFAGSFAKRVSGSARLIADLAHPGSILSTELTFQPEDRWVLSIGLDVLGSNSEPDPLAAGTDFISRWRDNDRFHVGVSYVF